MPHVHGPAAGRKLWLALGATLVFSAAEAAAGGFAHSLGLISDAGHNLSDALALGLAAWAITVARRPATARHTFGFHRVAILTALANATILLVIAVAIGFEAWSRLLHPQAANSALMIAVAAAALLLNGGITIALAGDARHSLNTRAAWLHAAGDACSSLALIAAGFLMRWTHWAAADAVASMFIGVLIAASAWGIVVEAAGILMESTPHDVDVDALVGTIRAAPHVSGVHDLHIWTVGDGMRFLSCHVVMPSDSDVQTCAAVIQDLSLKLAAQFNIGHATIQTEVDGVCQVSDDGGLYCAAEPQRADAGCSHSH